MFSSSPTFRTSEREEVYKIIDENSRKSETSHRMRNKINDDRLIADQTRNKRLRAINCSCIKYQIYFVPGFARE